MLNLLAAVLLLGFVIMFHELGHFTLAKLNKVGVLEFSIGLGPRLLSFVWGKTRYSLKLLPLGGSCAMADEDSDSGAQDGFVSKSVWARMSVIAAGPFFNFILAFVFGTMIVGYRGYDLPVISKVIDGYPAAASGVREGDLILSVNGQRMMDYRDLSLFLQLHPEQPLTIRLARLDQAGADGVLPDWYQVTSGYHVETVKLSTVFSEENQGYMMGIEHRQDYRAAESIGKLFRLGWHEVLVQGRSALESFGLLFRGYLGTKDLGGPVRIVADIGQVVEQVRPAGWLPVLMTLMNMGVVLSASLGVMNLLPLPALDGGRLLFLIIEAVRGKAINPEKEGMIHFAGMMILMGLMLLIMFNDIRNLIFR